ncbi:MAG: hypothetical protein AAFZ87_19125, partial [Planctomycetota bacterium]
MGRETKPIGTSDAGAPRRVGSDSVWLLARARGGRCGSPAGRDVSGCRGAVPAWIPLVGLFAALLVAVRSLEQDARSRGVAEIDTLRYRLQEGSRWLSPAWRGALEDALVDVRLGLALDQHFRLRGRTKLLSMTKDVDVDCSLK